MQLDVLQQMHAPKLVALDTMNFWITGSLPSLIRALTKVDILIINDSEANTWLSRQQRGGYEIT